MPKALINGINLYYEVHGKGEPLVLIQGFAGGAQAWGLQINAFRKHFRVVVLDNRGIGRTGRSNEHYTIKTMADDVIGLMDHLGIGDDVVHETGANRSGIPQIIHLDRRWPAAKTRCPARSAGRRSRRP